MKKLHTWLMCFEHDTGRCTVISQNKKKVVNWMVVRNAENAVMDAFDKKRVVLSCVSYLGKMTRNDTPCAENENKEETK